MKTQSVANQMSQKNHGNISGFNIIVKTLEDSRGISACQRPEPGLVQAFIGLFSVKLQGDPSHQIQKRNQARRFELIEVKKEKKEKKTEHCSVQLQ